MNGYVNTGHIFIWCEYENLSHLQEGKLNFFFITQLFLWFLSSVARMQTVTRIPTRRWEISLNTCNRECTSHLALDFRMLLIIQREKNATETARRNCSSFDCYFACFRHWDQGTSSILGLTQLLVSKTELSYNFQWKSHIQLQLQSVQRCRRSY